MKSQITVLIFFAVAGATAFSQQSRIFKSQLNLSDSQSWSASMRQVVNASLVDSPEGKLELIQFQSKDHALQISCEHLVAEGNNQSCVVELDPSLSQEGITDVEQFAGGKVQKVHLQNQEDVALFLKLQEYGTYSTSEKVTVRKVLGFSQRLPRLQSKCSSTAACELLFVPTN